MNILLMICMFSCLFCFIVLLRNELVYRIKLQVLGRKDWETTYKNLPDYDEMMSFKQLHLWTYKQYMKKYNPGVEI